MIASYTNNFIFIKTQKTGGTSAEIALSATCSGVDIVTTISPDDEILRRQSGGQPRNFSSDKGIEAAFLAAIDAGDLAEVKRLRKGEMPSPYYNHMTAAEVGRLIPDLWREAFKFTIERHPYDRAISMAWWRARGSDDKFSSALEDVPNDPKFPNHRQYFDGRTVLVDRIIEYSRLTEELNDIAGELGFPLAQLPRAKGNFRKDLRSANEVLTAEQKARIYQVTAPEFEIMGYQR